MSLRPEELLCSSLSCRRNLWTWPYISILLWGMEHSVEHIAAIPPPSRCSSSPGQSPETPACQAGWREKEPRSVWPGREGRPEFPSFPLWLLQDFSVKVFTGWVGLFYQSQILADQFSVRSFSSCSPRPEPADLTSPNPAQPCPTDGRI